MKVCRTCLMGIESHEGEQIKKHLYVDYTEEDEEFEEESRCEWCEENGFTELYEI